MGHRSVQWTAHPKSPQCHLVGGALLSVGVLTPGVGVRRRGGQEGFARCPGIDDDHRRVGRIPDFREPRKRIPVEHAVRFGHGQHALGVDSPDPPAGDSGVGLEEGADITGPGVHLVAPDLEVHPTLRKCVEVRRPVVTRLGVQQCLLDGRGRGPDGCNGRAEACWRRPEGHYSPINSIGAPNSDCPAPMRRKPLREHDH
jgi:hypothetical protein